MKPGDQAPWTPRRVAHERESRYPDSFLVFLANRAIRKLSPHTAKAYRQDFAAIATLLAGDPGARRAVDAGRDYEGCDADGLRRLCRLPRGRVDPALLVELEHVVRLSLHG